MGPYLWTCRPTISNIAQCWREPPDGALHELSIDMNSIDNVENVCEWPVATGYMHVFFVSKTPECYDQVYLFSKIYYICYRKHYIIQIYKRIGENR